jgi:dTDP-glucose pyrophosphorylase
MFLKEILLFHKKNDADATIGVTNVKNPTRHGMIKPGENNLILDIIEKPLIKDSPSKLGCIGIYVFKPSIFNAIKRTKPGYNKEYQLTDSIKILLEDGLKVYYKEINGEHIDIGTLEDLRKANSIITKL